MNLLICTKAELDNDSYPNPPQKPESIPPNEGSNDDTLPPCILKRTVANILTPDIFSQANPLDYILSRATKLSKAGIRVMDSDIQFFLKTDKFPQRYIPYAKVLSSLLQCLIELQNATDSIQAMHERLTSPPDYALSPDLTTPDPKLSSLFSLDIFYDTNPPSRLVNKLLDIPPSRIANILTRLRKLYRSNSNFSGEYHWYILHVICFINQHNKGLLRKLRRNVSEMQSTIAPTFKSSDFDPQNSNNIQLEDDLSD